MCTLIVGRDVIAPGSVLLAANRDEEPGRAADPPGVLREIPRLVGGRDRRAGGTWLAIREGRAVTAVLNRRDASGQPAPPAPGRRSRGALVLDVAAAGDEDPSRLPPTGGRAEPSERLFAGSASYLERSALRRAMAALEAERYAPCTLVFATARAAWLVSHDGESVPRFGEIPAGWHVLTHADLDDPDEPRTARLVRELSSFRPLDLAEAEQRVDALLRSHGDPAAGVPAVCLHEGRVVTVSASSVWLAANGVRYRHVEGRPCEGPLQDLTQLAWPGVAPGRER